MPRAGPLSPTATRLRADDYAALAESRENVMGDARRDEILNELDTELGNCRAAIAWSLAQDRADVGLRLATALREFWYVRNHIVEAASALEELTALGSAERVPALRGRALVVAGSVLSWLGGDDRIGPDAFAHITLGLVAAERGDRAAALERHREGLRRARAAGAHVGVSMALEAIAALLLDASPERALVIAAAAARLRRDLGGNVGLSELRLEPPLERGRSLVSAADYDRAVVAGSRLAVDEAVALALAG